MNEVVIEVKADNSQLAKDLKTAKREVEKFDKEAEKLATKKEKIELDLSDYYEEKRLLNETTKEELHLARSVEDTARIQRNHNTLLDDLNSKYANNLGKLSEINAKIKQNEISQQIANTRVDELNNKVNKINFDKVKDNIGKITTGMNKTLKSIAKWTIAVFGLRSAYNAVRKAASTLASYNDEFANKLEYINLFMASALEPLLNRLVSLAMTLLQYIDYIVAKWFGFNIISSANQKAVSKIATSTKEINDNLAGWDDLTVLSDTDASKGGAGGISTPKLEPLPDEEAPQWLQFIVKYKDEILAAFWGVASALTLWNLGFSGLKALGIGGMIMGIVYAVEKLKDYLDDPTFKNLGGVIQGIGAAIVSLGIMIGVATGGWVVAIIGAIVLIVGTLMKYWDKIRKFFRDALEKGQAWIDKIGDWLVNKLGWIGYLFKWMIDMSWGFIADGIDGIIELFDDLFYGIKQITDGIIEIFRGNFKQGLISIIKGLVNIIIGILNSAIGGINALLSPARALIVAFGKVTGKKWTMADIRLPYIPKLEHGAILRNPGPGVNIGGAIAGEKGAEGIFPLENSRFIDSFADKIAGKVNTNQTITFKGSLSELVRLLKPELDRESIRQGSKIIVGGN